MMIDESHKPLSPSRKAGTLPSGLSLRNSSSAACGNTGTRSSGMFFSASATRTLRTNGDRFTPRTVGMGTVPPSQTDKRPGSTRVKGGVDGGRVARLSPSTVADEHPWLAATLDVVMRPMYPARRFVVPEATGTVLEVGVGTGLNFDLYGNVTALEGI